MSKMVPGSTKSVTGIDSDTLMSSEHQLPKTDELLKMTRLRRQKNEEIRLQGILSRATL